MLTIFFRFFFNPRFAGETLINDIALSCQSSAVLYAAAGSQVRIWDIRKFSSTGKLSGGHQAAVMCLAVGNTPMGGMTDSGEKVEFVVTGSKDHYVKVFEVRDGATGVLSPRQAIFHFIWSTISLKNGRAVTICLLVVLDSIWTRRTTTAFSACR